MLCKKAGLKNTGTNLMSDCHSKHLHGFVIIKKKKKHSSTRICNHFLHSSTRIICYYNSPRPLISVEKALCGKNGTYLCRFLQHIARRKLRGLSLHNKCTDRVRNINMGPRYVHIQLSTTERLAAFRLLPFQTPNDKILT